MIASDGVGVLDAPVEVDLVDAVGRVLDHVLVAGPALLLAAEHGRPVALGQRVGEPVHGRAAPGSSSSDRARPQWRPRSSATSTAVCTTRSREMRRTTSSWGSGDPAHAASAPTSSRSPTSASSTSAPWPVTARMASKRRLGLLDEPGLLAHRPARRLGERRWRRCRGAPGHLLGLAVEGVEQRLAGRRLAARRPSRLPDPLSALRARKRLQVAQRELGARRRRAPGSR